MVGRQRAGYQHRYKNPSTAEKYKWLTEFNHLRLISLAGLPAEGKMKSYFILFFFLDLHNSKQ